MMNRHRVIYFLFNITLFALLCQFVFAYNAGRLFIGNDGPMLLSLAVDKLRYIGLTFDLHSNFLQGIGNLSFPVNPSLLPPFWLDAYNEEGVFAPAAIYTGFAVMTFVSVLMIGWNHGFSRGQTYAAAWMLTILIFPFFAKYVAVYPVNASSPIFMTYLFAGALADIGLWKMGRGSRLQSAAYAGLLLFAMLIMLLVSPAALIIIAPFVLVSGICAFIAADKTERKRKLILAFILFVIAAVAGWIEYVLGLLLYSSSGFFIDEMMYTYWASRQFGSILYQGRIADRSAGPFLFVLGMFGAVLSLYLRQTKFFWAAVILLVGQGLHGFIGAEAIKRSGGWSGPPPIYSEMLFYVFYALFTVCLIDKAREKWWPQIAGDKWRYGLPVVTVGVIIAVTLVLPAQILRDPVKSYAMPPADNAMTKILEEEISLPPEGEFRGRVAFVMPANFNWQMHYGYRMNQRIGNDMQTSGLWAKNIPTLTEYNQIITPQFYLLIKHFLSLKAEAIKQNRSWTVFSHVDIQMLRLLGVRFLLSNEAYIEGLEKLGFLAPEGLQELRLYEIDHPNVEGIAADKITWVPDLNEALVAMKAPDFSLQNAVIVGEEPKEKIDLFPVTYSNIRLQDGAYRIFAKSTGPSLLILPIEMSHCMEVRNNSRLVAQPRLIKVNIALTGVMFEEAVDISLTARTGPFHNPRCRLKDYREFKAQYRREP